MDSTACSYSREAARKVGISLQGAHAFSTALDLSWNMMSMRMVAVFSAQVHRPVHEDP